jgi:hypothetical protein
MSYDQQQQQKSKRTNNDDDACMTWWNALHPEKKRAIIAEAHDQAGEIRARAKMVAVTLVLDGGEEFYIVPREKIDKKTFRLLKQAQDDPGGFYWHSEDSEFLSDLITKDQTYLRTTTLDQVINPAKEEVVERFRVSWAEKDIGTMRSNDDDDDDD